MGKATREKGPRRPWLWALATPLALLILLLLLLAAGLALPGLRTSALDRVIQEVVPRLPGDLVIRGLDWSRLGRLEAEWITWTEGADTLATLGPLAIEVDLGALLQRDLLLRELRLEGLSADLPAILQHLPPAQETDTSSTEAGGWLREGSLPGLPSLAVLEIRIQGDELRLDSLSTVENLRLVGEVRALSGSAPSLVVDTLALADRAKGLSASGGSFRLDPAAGHFSGFLALDAGEAGRLSLQAQTVGRDRWSTLLDLKRGDWTRQLELGGALTWTDDRRLESLGLEARVALPTAGELEQLELDVSGLPSWPELALELQGLFRPEEGSAELKTRLAPNAWDLVFVAAVDHNKEQTRLQELRVALGGMEILAEALVREESLKGSVQVENRNLEWARRLDLDLPEGLDLQAAFQGEVFGSTSHSGFRLHGGLAADLNGSHLDSLTLSAERQEGEDAPLQIEVEALAFEQRLSLAGAVHTGAQLRADLREFRLDEATGAFSGPDGKVRVTRSETGVIHVETLQLGGNWLELSLDGALGSGTNEARLDLRLRRLPDRIRQTFVPAERDSLFQSDWSRGAPPGFSARAIWAKEDLPWGARAEAELHLPGPARLRALLPPGARVEDLEDLDLRLSLGEGSIQLQALPSEWLRELAASLQPQPSGGLLLDSLALALPGLKLRALGALPGDTLALDTRIDFDGTEFASRLSPALKDLQPRLGLEADLRGTAEAPLLHARLAGSLGYGDWNIDTLTLDVSRNDTRLLAHLDLAKGLKGPGPVLDALSLHWEGPANARSGRAALELSGGGWRHEQELSASLGDSLVLDWQLLALSGPEGDLRSRSPFRVIQGPEGGLELSAMELEGSLGTVLAEGSRQADGHRVRLAARLAPFALLERLEVPEALRPDSLELDLFLDGDSLHHADVVLGGMRLDSRNRLDLELSLQGGLQRPVLHAHALSAGDSLLSSRTTLPYSVSATAGQLQTHPERLQLVLEARAFPLPFADLAPEAFRSGEQGALSGSLHLDGRADRLDLATDLSLAFTGSRRLEGWRVILKGEIPASSTSAVLLAETSILHHRESILKGRGRLAFLKEEEGAWRPDSLRAELQADSLDFRRLNDWLPADLWLDGNGRVALTAAGEAINPSLSGHVRLRELKIGQASGTRLYTSADLQLAGRLSRPSIEGWVSLDNGVVAIPDLPRSLHPVEGEARLWQLEAPDADSTAGRTSAGIADSLQLKVQLRVPRPIRFEGRDLQLAASGELDIEGEGGMPRLSGELAASDGQFSIMGRQVELSRGEIGFYGEGALDPALDLELGTQIDETEVFVGLRGSFQKPVLSLSSEPELAEGEILSLLLFGRPGQELDMDQQELLQQRATNMATEYGMAQLGARVAREFGVDLLRFNREGAGGGSSLELGKYLGPRVFVRYEQALDRQDIFRLRLDYVLSSNLRLESTLGRQSQSGLAFSWKWRK